MKIFEEERLYTGKEVMDVAQIGLTTLNDLVKTKTLKVIRLSQRIRRFHGSTLNELFVEK